MLKTLRANWIALASSMLFLAAVFYILKQQERISTVFEVWRQINGLYFALAILLTLVLVQTMSAWRIQIIISADGIQGVQFRSLFRIQLISQFVANGALIAAFADLARAAMIKLRYHLTLTRSVRLVFYERLCAALGAVLIGLLAAIVLLGVAPHTKLVYAQLSLWISGLLGTAGLLVIGSFRVQSRFDLLNRIGGAIVALRVMLSRPSTTAFLILASIGQMLSFATVYVVLAKSMHLSVPTWYIMLYMPLIFFVSSLPIFYQGWGGREAVIIAVMGDLGQITNAQSVALSVAFGVVVFIASLPGAIFWIMRPSMRKAVEVEATRT
jgi:uncharacterized membrane protein YbhN (UPF0104 family)